MPKNDYLDQEALLEVIRDYCSSEALEAALDRFLEDSDYDSADTARLAKLFKERLLCD